MWVVLSEEGKVEDGKHTHLCSGLSSGASLVAQTVKRLPTIRETRVQSLGWEDRLEKEMATHSSIHSRSLVGYSPWGHKESDTTE